MSGNRCIAQGAAPMARVGRVVPKSYSGVCSFQKNKGTESSSEEDEEPKAAAGGDRSKKLSGSETDSESESDSESETEVA